ncbi:MAG: tetrapyrrole methylase family protein / MazG family protein [Chloroflexi bacterium]|jgi:tetrapyrrole methylase family protein/MazG family protein|nr:MAG: tetrapyrrole methylase family protein / MazG family protein [Chloroflexota bacterium]
MTKNPSIDLTYLVKLIADLRGANGCPWDKQQTHESLKRYLLEESYEVFDSIDQNKKGLAEELGDVLLQVLLHSQIASEKGTFAIDDVLTILGRKLIERHPHVFGKDVVRDAIEVEAKWEQIKQEGKSDTDDGSILSSIPSAMPALAYGQLMQERASRNGFDWDEINGVLDKVSEEIQEIKEAKSEQEKIAEFGDLLFSLVNVSRWMGIEAEDSMRQASSRFKKRFSRMEELAKNKGTSFSQLQQVEKDILWERAKILECS